MDRLDKLSAGAIVIFLVWALVLIVQQLQDDSSPGAGLPRQEAMVRIIDPDLNKKIELAKKLLANNNVEQAAQVVDQLIVAYPFEGMPYMLKGDIFLYRQQPVLAMLEYKKAIEFNPDFLDKNTEIFQGKKIKKTVEEAFVAIEAGLDRDPGNEELTQHKKTLYYMLRKIAGSCS